jgi:HD-GYP domain-containing protein (c-di-GMP phosphodiesterase class II)
MASENSRFMDITIEYLYPGLVLYDDIYSYDGALLLLAKGITLTDVMIKRLKNFNSLQSNVRVSAKLYKELFERGFVQKHRQDALEAETGYSEVKNETKSMLTIAQVTNQVPYKQVCDIGKIAIERMRITNPAVLFQCISGSDEIDEYLFRHSANVAIINGLMGKWLGLDEKETEDLVILGLVHDIGKLRVPDGVLNVPRKFNDQEYEIVKKHPIYSHEMLSENYNFSDKIKLSARHHHEMMNGSGYPDGLRADEIPLYARITAVSNAYAARVSQRCYAPPESPFRVLAQMKAEQFSGLDIRLVNLFCDNMPKELLGKPVLMSNGMSAVVRFINDNNIEFPIVDVNGETMITNDKLYCVSMIIEE